WFFFSSRRRHTSFSRDWSSDVCSSDLHERLDGPARIGRFLNTREATRRFEQEAKVLRQLLASDAAFYVIDARDPVLGKHRDELEILAACARPLLDRKSTRLNSSHVKSS